ncbi:Hypothetical_protein [Hexamita inflata]|uniref:Hypothetical_protein n=1 Tax=Hexamita inflata TaxID=28002 RepID=A0AA86QTP3_9EUKA|nr:Hypothetical protein HINF_LOCUS53494 [Hexamita inflata]
MHDIVFSSVFSQFINAHRSLSGTQLNALQFIKKVHLIYKEALFTNQVEYYRWVYVSHQLYHNKCCKYIAEALLSRERHLRAGLREVRELKLEVLGGGTDEHTQIRVRLENIQCSIAYNTTRADLHAAIQRKHLQLNTKQALHVKLDVFTQRKPHSLHTF